MRVKLVLIKDWFISGSFKVICSKHTETADESLTIKNRHTYALRRKFRNLTDHRIIIIKECCLRKADYKNELKQETWFDDQFGLDVLEFLKSYKKEDFLSLNFSSCVQSPRILTKIDSIDIDHQYSSYKMKKMDMNFDYLKTLQNPEFRIPRNNKKIHLLHEQVLIIITVDSSTLFIGI